MSCRCRIISPSCAAPPARASSKLAASAFTSHTSRTYRRRSMGGCSANVCRLATSRVVRSAETRRHARGGVLLLLSPCISSGGLLASNEDDEEAQEEEEGGGGPAIDNGDGGAGGSAHASR